MKEVKELPKTYNDALDDLYGPEYSKHRKEFEVFQKTGYEEYPAKSTYSYNYMVAIRLEAVKRLSNKFFPCKQCYMVACSAMQDLYAVDFCLTYHLFPKE